MACGVSVAAEAGSDISVVEGSHVVVITAGAKQNPGQTRIELAGVNAGILKTMMPQLLEVAPNAIYVIVTNPCDVLAHFIVSNTGYPPDRVISAGCVIDTARLMKILGDRVGLDPKNVFGMVMGEHGMSATIPWSIANIAGLSIDDYCVAHGMPPFDKAALLEDVKQAGIEIFRRKFNTNHGIAASVFRIIRAITINEHSVLPVGTQLNGEYGLNNVVLSVPCVVNAQGIERVLRYPLLPDELAQLAHSADLLRKVIDQGKVETGLDG